MIIQIKVEVAGDLGIPRLVYVLYLWMMYYISERSPPTHTVHHRFTVVSVDDGIEHATYLGRSVCCSSQMGKKNKRKCWMQK